MHGQIGKPNSGVEARGDLGFYYRNRAAMFDAFRRLGNGTVDYDFYRARARVERQARDREGIRAAAGRRSSRCSPSSRSASRSG
jgi:hypothetical protein